MDRKRKAILSCAALFVAIVAIVTIGGTWLGEQAYSNPKATYNDAVVNNPTSNGTVDKHTNDATPKTPEGWDNTAAVNTEDPTLGTGTPHATHLEEKINILLANGVEYDDALLFSAKVCVTCSVERIGEFSPADVNEAINSYHELSKTEEVR